LRVAKFYQLFISTYKTKPFDFDAVLVTWQHCPAKEIFRQTMKVAVRINLLVGTLCCFSPYFSYSFT